ncbi:MAG: Fur family transcriptional regulator [Acidobacteriota bacterium]
MCGSCDPSRLLEGGGLKATPMRLRVLSALLASGEAQGAPALLELLRREAPADKVSLYRTLEALLQAGLATRHEAGDGSVRYCAAGPAHPDHHHFYCLSCRRLYCLEQDAVSVGTEVQGVSHVSVRLDGTCQRCRTGVSG